MVAPVASANRASAEDDGSLITINVNGAKKNDEKDVSRPTILRHYSGIGAGVVLVVRRTCGR